MKKILKSSLVLAMGTSFFLFSKQGFAETVIYNPMNPYQTATPIPNDDNEISDSLSSSEETAASSAEEPETYESLEDDEPETTKPVTADQSSNGVGFLLPEERLKPRKETSSLPLNNPYLTKLIVRPKNQVLMLDDDFFTQTTVLPPLPESGSGAGSPNDYGDIALSAYLLSGIVLYGEANGQFDTEMSDYFAR